jgi:hypothetical protein
LYAPEKPMHLSHTGASKEKAPLQRGLFVEFLVEAVGGFIDGIEPSVQS